MNCYEAIDLMGNALEGGLDQDSRPGFEEHLDECPPCRTYYSQLGVTLQAIERLPGHPGSNPRRSELIERFRREMRDRSS